MTNFAPRILRAQTAAATIIALSVLSGAASMPSDAGIKLDNRSGIALDLWLDRDFVCHAPKDATCTVRVQPGEHELQARTNHTVVAREFVAVNAGESFSYRVERNDSPNGQAPSLPMPMHTILFGTASKSLTI
jgi:hypothetical protein